MPKPYEPQPQPQPQRQPMPASRSETHKVLERAGAPSESSAGSSATLVGVGVVAVAAIAATLWFGGQNRASRVLPDLAVPNPDHEFAAQRVATDGLCAGDLTIRDWSDSDADGLYLNGMRLVATTVPQTVQLPPGQVTIGWVPGMQGCISLELTQPGQPPIQLCQPPNSPTVTLIVAPPPNCGIDRTGAGYRPGGPA
jgi:hypothetical protein